jgi:biotin carboxyl carrier protein
MLPSRARALAAEPAEAADWLVLSPMMGIVREIYVSPGDTVKAGDILVVVEAMKMNNDLKARRPGRVQEVYVSAGERVEQGRALLLLTQA